MTAVAESTETTATPEGTGRVARVIGPVVDVEFSVDTMPEIYNALQVDVTLAGEDKMLTLEVAQHLGDSLVRGLASLFIGLALVPRSPTPAARSRCRSAT